MVKTATIKKVVNGEIADGDDVNQIVENAGTEGGAIPYSEVDQTQEGDGRESLGSTAFPWGSLFVNRNADLVEVDPASNTNASSVTFSQLRKFISQKDTPATYAGAGGQVPKVKTDETGLEFGAPTNIEMFTSSGTFNVPAGISLVFVTLVGGGGGGGGAGGAGVAGGGGGGPALINYPFTVTPSGSETVTIGGGGNGGIESNGTGGAGGASSLGSLSAAGGFGGIGGNGGAGGAGGSRDAGTAPAAGAEGIPGGSGGTGGGGQTGGGGGSAFGDGAAGVATSAGVGTDGSGNGAGGGGASTGIGGAGSDGMVIVTF